MAIFRSVPVFALEEHTGWFDLEDAMTGSIEYQSTHLKHVLPLMFFAPMTTPDNLDAWEPMKEFPQNLLAISIERDMDARVLLALRQAEPEIGPVGIAPECTAVEVHYRLPLTDVFAQMDAAKLCAYAHTYLKEDSPMFFFLRGLATVKAFNEKLSRIES